MSTGYDFSNNRVNTGSNQFTGMQSTPAWQNQSSIGLNNSLNFLISKN